MKLLKTLTPLFILAAALSSCSTARFAKTYQLEPPPNGISINETLYCDETEITNFFWLEYLYWISKTYGPDSREYKAALPKANAWTEKDSCLQSFDQHYLRHVVYRDYPLVGITQQQAVEYCKWRSDRVFEYVLLKAGKIREDTAQNSETFFTIEKYYSGNLKTILPGEKAKFYPEFRLPTFAERAASLRYADSVDHAYFDQCRSEYCRKCAESQKFNANNHPCGPIEYDFAAADPTWVVYAGCHAKKGEPIYNLRGNVSEWLAELNMAAGGSWTNSKEEAMHHEPVLTNGSNAWTGFRCVSIWKEWKP